MAEVSLFELYIVSAALVSIAIIAYMSYASLQKTVKERKRIVTVLKCSKCGRTYRREFREGDYVGRVVDEKCRSCGGDLVVDAIYEEEGEDIRQALERNRKGAEA